MTNPLLKAAGITPDTPGHSAERALFDAAWACITFVRQNLCEGYEPAVFRRQCCGTYSRDSHTADCPLVAFDKAAKYFQEDV